MNINVYYEYLVNPESARATWYYNLNRLPDKLSEKYPEHVFNKVIRHSSEMCYKHPWNGVEFFDKNKHATITDTIAIIENAENKKYFVVSLWDKGYYEISAWGDLKEKCVEIFATQGMHLDDYSYTIGPLKYTPLNMPVTFREQEEIIDEFYYENLLNDKRIIPEKLYFASLGAYLFRDYIKDDPRFDFRNKFVKDVREWLSIFNQYKINIDINCVSETSTRAAEIMGLGCCLLRPKIRHEYNNPVIPNFHYAAVEIDHYVGSSNYPIKDYYKDLADAYINTFNKIKNDNDFINYISKNGREYYENYCTTEKWIGTLINLIDINKLK